MIHLLQLVSDKSHERRLGVSMLNALHKTDGKRKMWNKPGRYLIHRITKDHIYGCDLGGGGVIFCWVGEG